MVKVEEIFSGAAGLGTLDDDAEYEDVSDVEEEASESILDRITALSDIIPFAWRLRARYLLRRTSLVCQRWTKYVGHAAWIFTTSMILVGLPILFAYDREKSTIEFEKEQQKYDSKQN